MVNKIANHKKVILLLACSWFFNVSAKPYDAPIPPRVTIIFVVDQLAYHYFPLLAPHFTGGLKYLMKYGITYTNAYWPYAAPSTGPGHTGLNTGTFPKDHGIIRNSWYDNKGNKIKCDDDTAEQAAVFLPDGTSAAYGKSSCNIMVDGISDQLILQSNSTAKNNVFAISLKSRSAITCANELGKAIWFDPKTGYFTSSKAYFDHLPDWITEFNKQHDITKLNITWKLTYRPSHDAYHTLKFHNYENTRIENSLIGATISIDPHQEKPFKLFQMTPAASSVLLDLAKECVRTYVSKNKNDRLMLWISISSLDKVGHVYGAHSKEVIDTIYHIDKQLKRFIKFLERRVKRSEILYVLTADHGVDPIPEYLNHQGFSKARRIIETDLAHKIDAEIKKYDKNVTCICATPYIYLNSHFYTLESQLQNEILAAIKSVLKHQPGIKQAWTNNELLSAPIKSTNIEYYFKNQIYPGRGGPILFQVFPFNIVTNHTKGTSHNTPYEWNTHVPLIIYQRGLYEYANINEKVWVPQLANSLAQIHNIPKPSASTFEMLPGLIEPQESLY